MKHCSPSRVFQREARDILLCVHVDDVHRFARRSDVAEETIVEKV